MMKQTRGAIILAILAMLVDCHGKKDSETIYSVLTGEVFHTFYQIKYDLAEDHALALDSTFKNFSHSLNPFDSTSLISAINRNTSIQTDSMIRYVWRMAEAISRASNGSYDVTCAPLVNAWGFGFDSLRSVTPQTIDSLRSFVGYQRIKLQGEKIIKEDHRSIINFSSISKGYCSDLVGEMLQNKGANNYLVELGGEIAFRGKNPQGQPWRIGINKPVDDPSGIDNSELQLIIKLDRPFGGIATSGNYRNYKIKDGKKYAHTIDPLTGYPIQTDVLSATILAPSCILADGLATACMTMPSSAIPNLISHFPDVEYLLILGNKSNAKGAFTTLMSDGFQKLIVEEK